MAAFSANRVAVVATPTASGMISSIVVLVTVCVWCGVIAIGGDVYWFFLKIPKHRLHLSHKGSFPSLPICVDA